MLHFTRKYGEKITGILSGFDRVVFRGVLRTLMYLDGMRRHLSRSDVPRREFGRHVERMTEMVKEASLAEAHRLGRPIIYLASSETRKEAVARRVLEDNPVEQGLICVLKCVEPCQTYGMHKNAQTKQLELVHQRRKCLFLYHYYLDPVFGFMNARIQTWYPFPIQICLNGREWLKCRMDETGLAYRAYENSFPSLEDPDQAQRLMDEFLTLNWPESLNAILYRLNPAHDQMFGATWRYYWTAHQTEWATDLIFRSPGELAQLYPRLVWGAITTFSTPRIMRFLGKRFRAIFEGTATSYYTQRPEGLSVKHQIQGNGLKMYDKAGTILRIETTLNNPQNLKVFRATEGGDPEKKTWQRLRKGIADLHRRAEVCQRANERYLDALSQFDTDTTLAQLLTPVCRRISYHGSKFRGLRPGSPHDHSLLRFINRPEYLTAGFSNRDLSAVLFPRHQTTLQSRRAASGKTSYRLRLLHAHGLIAKLPNTRRYRITAKGQRIATALLLAQNATVSQLNPKAA